MQLICDLCGGRLEVQPHGGVCPCCGLEYSAERIQEKMPPAPPAPSKSQPRKKLGWAGVVLAIVGVVTFLDGLLVEDPLVKGGILLACMLVAAVTILIVTKQGKNK